MVEAAAQVLWGGGATPSGYVKPWRERYGSWQHPNLIAITRAALQAATAARAGKVGGNGGGTASA
jgi:hypothetical protein